MTRVFQTVQGAHLFQTRQEGSWRVKLQLRIAHSSNSPVPVNTISGHSCWLMRLQWTCKSKADRYSTVKAKSWKVWVRGVSGVLSRVPWFPTVQCNPACKKVSAASKQNQAADSGLCNVAPHISRLRRKNRARFLQLNVSPRRREGEQKEEKKKNLQNCLVL